MGGVFEGDLGMVAHRKNVDLFKLLGDVDVEVVGADVDAAKFIKVAAPRSARQLAHSGL